MKSTRFIKKQLIHNPSMYIRLRFCTNIVLIKLDQSCIVSYFSQIYLLVSTCAHVYSQHMQIQIIQCYDLNIDFQYGWYHEYGIEGSAAIHLVSVYMYVWCIVKNTHIYLEIKHCGANSFLRMEKYNRL